jgi:hypothetical protein
MVTTCGPFGPTGEPVAMHAVTSAEAASAGSVAHDNGLPTRCAAARG